MLEFLGKGYRLVPRDGAGLSCDENGVRLGGFPLIRRETPKSMRAYVLVGRSKLTEAMNAAYGATGVDEIQRIEDRLGAVARALNAGNPSLAAIIAVQMRMPEISADAERRLIALRALQKYSPDQPRVPAGNPDGGEWTSAGSGSETGGDHQPTRTAQIPIPMPLPMPIPGLPKPYAVPNIPFPQLFDPPPANPFPDRSECVEEWSNAYDFLPGPDAAWAS